VAPPERPIVSVQSIGTLQTQLAHVQARLAAQPESRPDLNNLVKRLAQLIDQAAQEEQRLTEGVAASAPYDVQPSAELIM
jgi:hypothetical protein